MASAGGGSGNPRNSAKNRRADSSSCLNTSATVIDLWMRPILQNPVVERPPDRRELVDLACISGDRVL